jgi:hypothetical protein
MQDEINEMGVSDTTGLRRYSSALSKDDVKRARERAALRVSEARQVYQQSVDLALVVGSKTTDCTAALAPIDTCQIEIDLLVQRTADIAYIA